MQTNITCVINKWLLVCVISVIAVLLVFALPTQIGYYIFEECVTPKCVLIANQSKQMMNLDVHPCDDFFEFACGRFITEVEIPRKAASIIPWVTNIQDKVWADLFTSIREPVYKNDSKPIAMAKKYFADCMDLEAREAAGLEPLLELIEQIGGWPIMWGENDSGKEEKMIGKWWQLAEKCSSAGVNGDILINIKAHGPYIYLFPPKIVTPSEMCKFIEINPVLKVAELLGASNSKYTIDETQNVLEFENNLNGIKGPLKAMSPLEMHNPFKLEELQNRYPYVNWITYINSHIQTKVQVNSSDTVIVTSPEYLTRLGKLINDTPDRVVANFMVWIVVKNLIPFTNKKLAHLYGNYTALFLGRKEMAPDSEICLQSTRSNLPFALDSLYLKRQKNSTDTRPKENGHLAIDIVNNIKQVMADHLRSDVQWMDPLTKSQAQEKLQAIEPIVGYPSYVMDYMAEKYLVQLDVDNSSYFDTSVQLLMKGRQVIMQGSTEINAFYSYDMNSIVISDALMQDRIFDQNHPKYWNFATFGSIVSHEIMHGFDSNGRHFDKNGNMTNWWEPDSSRAYQERAKCLHDQYSNFTDPQTNQALNVNLTQVEDIADNGGIQIAYKTYQKWASRNVPEPVLPNLGLTSNQLFWLGYGQLWCGKFRTEAASYDREGNTHSPFRFRVLGPLKNSEAFSKDFSCPVGSLMNPEKKCSLL